MVSPQTFKVTAQHTYDFGHSLIQKIVPTPVSSTYCSLRQTTPLSMTSWLKYFKFKLWGNPRKTESAFQKSVRERIQNPMHQPPSIILPIRIDANGIGHLMCGKNPTLTCVPDAVESTNKSIAEQLLINDTIEKQGQNLPSAQTIGLARALLQANKICEPWLSKIWLQDKSHVKHLGDWIDNVEKRAAITIQRAFRKKRSLPELAPEQQAQIRESVQRSAAQTQKCTGAGLSYDDKVADGLLVKSGASSSDLAFHKETLRVNRREDALLSRYLAQFEQELHQNPNLQKLRQALITPENITGQKDEVLALSQLLAFVNQPFVTKLSAKNAQALYKDLPNRVGINNQFVKEFGAFYQLGKLKIPFNPYAADLGDSVIPLGTVLESGAGTCRHRALWTKVLVDDFSKSGAESTYILGKFNSRGHAWSKLKFPKSQREYLFDPMHGKIFDLADTKQLDFVQKHYKERI
jgi:hypothetical protein